MISEEALARAAREAGRALADGLPAPAECQHTFSPAFEEKMDRLLRRRRRRQRWYRGLRQAACFLAAVALGGAIFLGTNAQAQQPIPAWTWQEVEDGYEYSHQGTVTAPWRMVPYQITVPEGYRLDEDAFETRDLEDYVSECYVSQAGDRLLFSYIYGTQRRKDTRFFASKELEQKTVEIHGSPGELYLSPDPTAPSHLFWVDQSTDALLMVTAVGEEGRLVALAESVAPSEP